MKEVNNYEWMRNISAGEITLDQYKAFLRETYFQAGQNPQLQAFATAFFPQERRDTFKKFYQHAISEIGHDVLALDDLRALGVDVAKIPLEEPLPETLALTAYAFYQIQFRAPIGYLGYLYHLEALPTVQGNDYMSMLEKMGVPRAAMTFIEEHATVDIGHQKLMEIYFRDLVKTEDDLREVIFAAQTTAELHALMMRAACVAGAKLDLKQVS